MSLCTDITYGDSNWLNAKAFESFVSINFELEPHYRDCFDSLQPTDIVNAISAKSKQKITPGKTLLFLDEISECPQAIMALRYFKEKMPEQHVISAGSLLEFALRDENLNVPVGRVQYLYMKPVSFQEFLLALGYDLLLDEIKKATLRKPVSEALHKTLIKLVRTYFIVGGMPAVIQEYIDSGEYLESQRMQTVLLTTYRTDFGKYAKKIDHPYLQKVYDKTPALLGQQIKYNNIDQDSRSMYLKRAIEALSHAGVILPIYASSASGLPLNALINEKKFKLLFLDVGLANKAARVDLSDLLNDDLMLVNRGAIAEQFVGQELLAYQDLYESPQLHYWERDKLGSVSEVDYVISYNSSIIPIEVKAGATGRLKSINIMMEEKKLRLGVRISGKPLSFDKNILSVPFYMIGEIKRLI